MDWVSELHLLALRWLEAMISVPVWLVVAIAAGILVCDVASARFQLSRIVVTAGLLACAAVGGWWIHDLYASDQRRTALETRIAEWREQAISANSVLACLDTRVDPTVDAACERTLFARPEHLAAATAYLGRGLNLLADVQQYTGPRSIAFERELERMRTAIERDPFGLVANLMETSENCTPHSCDALLLLANPVQVQENMSRRALQKRVARHLDPSLLKAGTIAARTNDPVAPQGGPLVAAPLPSDYVLPSSATIPAVSIMTDESTASVQPAATPGASSGGPPAAATASPADPAYTQRRSQRRTRDANNTSRELRPLPLAQ